MGLILFEAFTTIMSGCSQENIIKLQVVTYRLDAALGDAHAQFNLGLCYYAGDGVAKDYREAVKWYRLAAVHGDSDAQYFLGLHYYSGEGVERDYSEAFKWYNVAAEQGNALAQYKLGLCYYYGEGITKNMDCASGYS